VALEGQRPPTIRAALRIILTFITRRWPLWLVLLIFVAVYAWRYATASEMRLYALSTTDGSVRWSASLPGGTEQIGIPAASDGHVLVLTEDDYSNPTGDDDWQISAFDAVSGQAAWRQTPTSADAQLGQALSFLPHVAAFTTDAHAFFVASRSRSRDVVLAVFELSSGRLVTAVPAFRLGDRPTLAPMTAAAGRIFVSTPAEQRPRLVALDEADWTERWSVPLDDTALKEARSGPFFAATSALVFSVQGRGVVAYDAATGTPRFALDARPDDVTRQLTVVGDTLYRLAGKDTISAYEAATGRPSWSYTRPHTERYEELKSFSVADGVLVAYCYCDDGHDPRYSWLVALDAADGRERWSQPVDEEQGVFFGRPVLDRELVITDDNRDSVVARSAADGSLRWRRPRALGREPAADGDLIFATDARPRWRHWLITLGLARPA
jgi:outer membrane protein assembly factor BamB